MARHAPPTQSLDWQIRLGSPGGVARAALGSLRFMNSTQWLIWALIAAVGLADWLLLAAQDMRVATDGRSVALLLGVCGLAVVMQRRNPAASRLAVAGAQVIVFTHVGAILTYGAMAATPFPMADPVLSRWDRALGFDWLGWFAFVHAHPALHLVLAVAYASVSVQMLGLLVYFAYFDAARLNELLVAALLAVVAITLVMVPLPAVGAWSQHGVGVEPWRADILGLRAHTMRTIGDTQGIVAFPSFHTILAVLLANLARGRRWFLAVLLLNVAMIVSVVSEGAHYGVDVLSGLAVAALCIAASRRLLAWCEQRDRGMKVRPAPRVASAAVSARGAAAAKES